MSIQVKGPLLIYATKHQERLTVLAVISFAMLVLIMATNYYNTGKLIDFSISNAPSIISNVCEVLAFAAVIPSFAILHTIRRLETHNPHCGLSRKGFLARLPEPLIDPDYMYRLATSPADLQPFIAFSDREGHIVGPKHLYGDGRRRLYERWLAWSGNSFLVLYKRNRDGLAWDAVAVSICLRITQEGIDFLMGPGGDAVQFQRDHVARTLKDTRAILIDTLIVAQPERIPAEWPDDEDPLAADLPNEPQGIRVTTKGRGPTLPLVHLGLLGKGHALPVIAEASHPSLDPVLRSIGFEPSQISGNKHLMLSTATLASGGAFLDRLKRNVVILAKTPIH